MSAIGIDLGTTYSCVGVFRHGRVEIISNDMGNRTTPSYVSFTDEERLVGDSAKNQASMNPTNTIFDTKRMIGRKYSDPIVQSDMKHWPFKVIQGDNDRPKIQVELKGSLKEFYPEEISSMILGKMKDIAETYLSEKVKDAVITVPAYFNDGQRQATKDAGHIAGLNVLRILNEPTAAAIAYGINEKSDKEKKVLIFDLGGGTLDVSLLEIENNLFEVISTSGNTHLGGEDFDSKMVDYFAERFEKKFHCNLRDSPRALRTLRTACERAKRTLSTATSASIMCDSLYKGHDFVDNISRAMFENLNSELFNSCIEPVQMVLKDANISKNEITDVVLVGGSSRIPRIQQLLAEFFAGKQPVRGVDPDEAVAYGAAVQAAILKGDSHEELEDFLLVDIIPLSLGVETGGELMTVLIPKNTKIPVKKSKRFTTSVDNQRAVGIKVYEGERTRTKDNNLLGMFDLNGITQSPRGVPVIDVTFDINADGIMNVVAEESLTGNSQKLTIKNEKGRLSQSEIDRIINESEKYKEEDDNIRKAIEKRNELESYIFRIKQSVNGDLNTKISPKDQYAILEEISRTIKWMEDNKSLSFNDLDTRLNEIQNSIDPIISAAYQNGEQNHNNGPRVDPMD